MASISAAELQKHFGRYREIAQREPVSVTSHGRESVVILSAHEYARLKALDQRVALHVSELSPEMLEALKKSEPPAWTASLDHLMEP